MLKKKTRRGEIFRPSSPALGPTKPPVQWVSGLSWGVNVRPGRATDPSPSSSAVVMEEKSYTSYNPLGHKRACNGNILSFTKKELLFSGLKLHKVIFR